MGGSVNNSQNSTDENNSDQRSLDDQNNSPRRSITPSTPGDRISIKVCFEFYVLLKPSVHIM